MKRAFTMLWVGFFFFGTISSLSGAESAPAESSGAHRVAALIQKIESSTPLQKGLAPRKEKVREDELNAYIVQRIRNVKDSVISELKLKLLDDNHVKGSFTLDFTGMDIPVFLSSYMTFHFNGRIETDRGKGRFLVSDLRMKDEPVTVEFLDMVLAIMASLNGYEPKGFQDWYELPYGILSIETAIGYAKITY